MQAHRGHFELATPFAEVEMSKIERLVVYAALIGLLIVALRGPDVVHADGPEDGSFGILTVRGLRLVAEDGSLAGHMRVSDNGGYMALHRTDAEGASIHLGLDIDGDAEIRLNVQDGQPSAVLATGYAGGFLSLENRESKRCAYLGVATNTKAGLLQLNRADSSRSFEVGTTEHGGHVKLQGAGGKTSVSMGTDEDGGNVVVYNGAGKTGAALWIDGGGNGLLHAARADGERAALVGTENGAGYVSLYRATEKTKNAATVLGVGETGGYLTLRSTEAKQRAYLGVGVVVDT